MAEHEELPTELPPAPSIDEITVPINESELEQFVMIQEADDLMKLDVRAFRELILSEFPIEDLFDLLNINGVITPEDLAKARAELDSDGAEL